MPNIKQTGRAFMVAALAASTTLTGPTFAFARMPAPLQLAQADEAADPSGDAPAKPRRKRPAEAGADDQAGQGRRQKREAAPEADDGAAPNRRAQRGSEDGSADAARPDRPSRRNRDAQTEGETARPNQAEEPATERPARRDRSTPSLGSDASAASDGSPTPRRQRRTNETAPDADTADDGRSNAAGEAGGASAKRRNSRNAADTAATPDNESSTAKDAATPNTDAERPATRSPASKAAAEPPATTDDGAAPRRDTQRRQTREDTVSPDSTQTEGTDARSPDTSRSGDRKRPDRENANSSTQDTATSPARRGAADTAGATANTPDAAATPTVDNPSASEVPAAPSRRDRRGNQPDAARSTRGRDRANPAAAPERPETATNPNPTPETGRTSADEPTAADAADAPPPPPRPRNLKPKAVPVDVQNAPVQPGGLDRRDAQVQTLEEPVRVRPLRQERGERLREQPRYEVPPDAKVVKKVGDRQILSIVGAAAAGAVAGAATGYFVKSNDDQRIGVGAEDRYTERLPRERTRETIVRPNGVQVVTISNRYGDVIQRSRVMPDGREVVLFYDPYSDEGRQRDYYDDPGRDLPPVRVDIPEDRYIVDVDQPDEELYYDTLAAPPVETVERIYSVDEVRRSTRIRNKVRRIDLATINFDFGSADVPQDQVDKLQDLADAIQKVVKDNPGETFLIEGHTDAVGSDVANLALSDRRAEAVASVLAEYFEVPSENLVTQGYGEQELKVDTQSANRENRRVTVRRITALVKPVATSDAQ